MMGLEPMTSPLPRECSTTELHQPLQPTQQSYRERSHPSVTRKAKNPNRSHVSERYLPGSIVCQARIARTPNTPSATAILPLPAGLKSTWLPCLPTATRQLRRILVVHKGGFEPPYVIDGQIYSLMPLT